jgi:hypothetical protein
MHEMTTAGAAERHVTEIAWSSHRSWVIRCGQCPKQVEVSDRSLGAVAAALCRLVEEFGGKDLPPVAAASLKAYGFPNGQIDDYVASDGQVRSEIPLGVLNRILTNING